MPFIAPCDRCGDIAYLDVATGLCVHTGDPVLLSEVTTCYEWARYYQATDRGVVYGLKDVA